MLLSEAAHAGRGGLSRGGLGRVEGGADLVVAEVVAVAEYDGRTLLRRQVVGQRSQILECGQLVLDGDLGQLALRAAASDVVDDDPARDREDPGAQMLPVLEARICAQCAEERLLERVFCAFQPEAPAQKPVDLVAVGLVERLEGRDHLHLETYSGAKM